jgi:hypothetical protein
MSFMRKLNEPRVWERIFRERLAEPLHLNLLSVPVQLFGSFRSKIYFDLVMRQHHAFGLLHAADQAKSVGLEAVSVIEFGVANGAGLVNICRIAERVTRATGIRFQVFGCDTGTGMPPPRDYRDHPEHYSSGDFPMQDPKSLRASMPSFAELVIGDLSQTVPHLLARQPEVPPFAFVSVDVDYYWSALESLQIFAGAPSRYLPTVTIYFDDVGFEEHNSWCGELAAIQEFNAAHKLRKIEPFNNLRTRRLFKKALWIERMYTLHVLDHARRTPRKISSPPKVLGNPYA